MPTPGSSRFDSYLATGGIFAAACWPVADLVLANNKVAEQAFLIDCARWVLALVVIGSVVTLVMTRPLGSWTRATALVAPLLVLAFSYPVVEPAIHAGLRLAGFDSGAAILYCVLLAAAAFALVFATRTLATQRLLLALAIAMFLSTSAAALVVRAGTERTPKEASAANAQLVDRPDIYEFIFDGMGRPDELDSALGVDLAWVASAFEAHGFTIAHGAEAVFLETEPSIHSILNPTDKRESPSVDIAGSEVVRRFRANGYRYNQYGEVFPFSACSGLEDYCLSTKRRGLSEVDVVMFRKTPLYAFFQRTILGSTSSRNLQHNLDTVAETRVPRPTLTIAYMVPPHPPFIFSAECRSDQIDFNDFRAWRHASISRYAISYRCVANNLLAAVDKIAARDPTAIILVSGDHGTMFRQQGRPKKVGWTAAGLAERRPVFLAARLPARCAPRFSAIQHLPEAYPVIVECLSQPTPAALNASRQ